MFAHISRLLLDPEHTPTGTESDALVNALAPLMSGIAVQKRKALAERVDVAEHPPRRLLGMLARDDIQVARVLLEANPSISQADLVEISRSTTQDHRLIIAERQDLTATVTDVLIESGDAAVIDVLVRNQRAAFSLEALARLAADFAELGSVATFLEQTLGQKVQDIKSAALVETAPKPVLRAVKTIPPAKPTPVDESPPAKDAAVAARPRQKTENERTVSGKPVKLDGPQHHIEKIVVSVGTETAPLPAAMSSAGQAEDFTRAMADWSWETDPFGRISGLSERAENAFGPVADRATGRFLEELGAFRAAGDGRRGAPDAMRRRVPFRGAKYEARAGDGGVTWWRISGVPRFELHNGKFLGYRGTAVETTVEHTLEEQAARKYEHLLASKQQLQSRSDRITRELAESLCAGSERAERLASVSHEFRTPLNAIIGFSDVIANCAAGTIEEKYTASARTICDAAWSLHSFVNDLLDSARIEAGSLEVERTVVDVHAVVCEVVSGAKKAAGEAEMSIRLKPVSADLRVAGDPNRIKQALGKMLDYAITQSAPKSSITAEACARGASVVSVELHCNGIVSPSGNPEDMFARIVPGENSKVDMPRIAPGFSLSFARELARLMGGDVTAASEPSGTRLRLNLPATL
ncbi:MAG: DUF2336 domain-containing protein [Sphingomonadales bacterium]